MAVTHQFTHLASEMQRKRLAHADQQRPAQRLLALSRATRRAGRRMCHADRQARRLRTQLGA